MNKIMTVCYKAGTDEFIGGDTPSIRIENKRYLKGIVGLKIGDKIKVSYNKDEIRINKL